MSIVLPAEVARAMVDHCMDAYPYEGCGLLGAPLKAEASGGDDLAITRCFPTANSTGSARIYAIDPKDLLRVDREAEDEGLEVVAVFHSHTHTEAYPSPTDVAQAPVPGWHYVLVSLAGDEPVIRSFRILDGKIHEESVVVGE